MATFRKNINDQQFIDMYEKGDTQGVIEAIHSGVNVNAKDGNFGDTVLQRAAENGHTEIVNALIEAGAKVNSDVLWHAAKSGHAEIINVLIKAGLMSTLRRESTLRRKKQIKLFLCGQQRTDIQKL